MAKDELTPGGPSARFTDSGVEFRPEYTWADVADKDWEADVGSAGEFPFTRGVYPSMYRGRLWTMRQYAGFASAEESNRRYHYLLERGQTGLSVAFDLPTQMGYDSDHPLSEGEVGKVGVAIDSLRDMEALFEGIPLDKVSTSMTINSPAAVLLLMYELVAEKQGVDTRRLRGTIQNDILKEYVARGTYIFPPAPSMRIITDIFAYCQANLPNWNTISISGYHIREAGSSAAEELAFTLANGIAYVKAAVEAGLQVDAFAGQLSFFFNAHNNLLEEVAKYRAARRMWADIMRDRFGATDPKSQMLRFHTQTAGCTLTAQQPHNNVVRVALQALAAVLGGTQSLHTNSFDEALALPSDESVAIALRTQQIIGYESGVADIPDPLAGSFAVETLTDDIQAKAQELMDEIDRLGGAVKAIEQGFMQRAIEDSAYEYQRAIERGDRVVVGLNKFASGEKPCIALHRVDPSVQALQERRLAVLREERDQAAVDAALERMREAARSSDNLLYPMKEALRAYATLGEIAGVLRQEFGEFKGGGSLHI
ncbi:MAG: methylmalonyl-CoA mutase family protein [Actinobacteria bacterium]|nr:methylmalonyl-CoA mutase family protein [Actinomycetota bacterium]